MNSCRDRVGGTAIEVVEAIIGALYLNLLSSKASYYHTCFTARRMAIKGATRNVTPEIARLDFLLLPDSQVFM
jgi:hypothetical protein